MSEIAVEIVKKTCDILEASLKTVAQRLESEKRYSALLKEAYRERWNDFDNFAVGILEDAEGAIESLKDKNMAEVLAYLQEIQVKARLWNENKMV